MKRSIAAFWVVLRKELSDALRDRRTLATVLVSSVLMGPLVLLAISGLVASLESRAEQREVYVAGVANAPTLRNFLERQTYVVKEAPADFEARLRRSTFSDPVVVVPADFEAALVRGDVPIVEIAPTARTSARKRARRTSAGSAAQPRARCQPGAARRLGAAARADPDRGPRPASTQTRATRITGMPPYFVMMAVLYGALNAALDTPPRASAARRASAHEPGRLGAGRRQAGAVACVSVLIAILSCFSFLPGQWVLRSDTSRRCSSTGRAAALFIASRCRWRRRSPRC